MDRETLDAILSGLGELSEEELKEEEGLEAGGSAEDAADGEEAEPAEAAEGKGGVGDPVALYLQEIRKIPLLTPGEEAELVRRKCAGDTGARDRLVEAYLRLVVSVARRYSSQGLSLLDLIQEGNYGLIRAVEEYDPAGGYSLAMYARSWIRHAIRRELGSAGQFLRIPVRMLETIGRVIRTRRSMILETGREPTEDELAERMGMSGEELREAIGVSRNPVPLDRPVGEDGEDSLSDFVPDTTIPTPEESAEKEMLREHIGELLHVLKEQERRVIVLRFGLEGNREHTLEAIGTEMGVTRERVRQIEKKALKKISEEATKKGLRDFI